jgi:tripartite-type tricarboxylate transporter receptor subunit TctC
MKQNFFRIAAYGLIGGVMSFANAALAEDYPSKPITMVVPFTAAGPTDALARMLAGELKQPLGQSVVVENRPGAGGNIGLAAVARSKPDGYTLVFSSSGPLLINPTLYKSLPYNPTKDFTPIAYVGEIPNVLVVNVNTPVANIAELVAYVKGRPQGSSYGSSGPGSTNHLAAERFKKETGLNIAHVPYKGTAPAMNDLLGNHITMMFVDVLTASPHIKAGKLRPLAVAMNTRSKILPNVPTFAEQSVSSMDQGVAFGLLAPPGLPPEVLRKLSDASRTALGSVKISGAIAE